MASRRLARNNKHKLQIGTMKKLKLLLIWILSTVFAAIIAYMVWKYIDSWGGLYNLLIYSQDLLLILVNLTTPLWATIALITLCCLYIYLKTRQYQNPQIPPTVQEDLHPALGVKWDTNFDIHCLYCGTLLKNSTHGPSIFFCANPHGKEKHVLKTDAGKELNKQEAINIMKSLTIG